MGGQDWDLDHIEALCNGGKNRESNLAPILKEEHKAKTREDLKEKATIYRKRLKHLGLKPTPSRPIPGSRASGWKRKISGEVVKR